MFLLRLQNMWKAFDIDKLNKELITFANHFMKNCSTSRNMKLARHHDCIFIYLIAIQFNCNSALIVIQTTPSNFFRI